MGACVKHVWTEVKIVRPGHSLGLGMNVGLRELGRIAQLREHTGFLPEHQVRAIHDSPGTVREAES